MIKKLSLIFSISLLVLIASCSKTNSNLDEFAKCLSEKNVKFYGAFWCLHCSNQKKSFGSSIQYVNYIECSTPDRSGQLQVCKDAGIVGYPTWEFPDKTRMEGEIALAILAEKSGCKLPA
jgi:hypothetical protein